MKRLIEILFVFLFFGMCLSFISAGFEIGNLSHSIEKQYGPRDFIKGWVNISLSDEPTNSVFSDSRGNSISLINLLRLNDNFSYSCNIQNCESDYLASNPATTKSFSLNTGGSKILGFKLIGNIQSIDSINFTLESNAGSSCLNQIKIDIANDGTEEIGNTKATSGFCTNNKGCFDEGESIREYEVTGTTPYCQRINLSESPGFGIGAWVRNAGGPNLTMDVYYGSGLLENTTCKLPKATSGGSEIFCEIDYLVTESEDYYVCIYSRNGGGGNYIRGYTGSPNVCGFHGYPPIMNEVAAYDIFAKGKKFADVGTLEIPNTLSSWDTFAWLVQDYIIEKYRRLSECETSGCVVPIKFNVQVDQNIEVSNLEIKYTDLGGPTSENKFYELREIPAKVNADFQKLYLNKGNFSVQENFGNMTFQLKLKNQVLFSEDIFIEKIPTITSLTPTTVAAAYPTEFRVQVDTHNSSANITSYNWKFGNGDTETTETNKVTYAYNSTGTFELKVTVTNSEALSSSKIFSIVAEKPIQAANSLLNKKLKDLNNIKSQIDEFPLFYQESLNSVLDISTFDEALTEVQILNASATSEEDYINIVTRLIDLNVPGSITASKTADSISFFPDDANIYLDVLQTIGGGGYDSESDYIDAILSWNQENLETKITFKELSAKYEYLETPVLRIFEISINKQTDLNPYFILGELDGLRFAQDYSEKNESGYVYMKLQESQQTISFTTTEDVDFTNLPLFISPALSDLSVAGPLPEEGAISKEVIFALIIILLLALGFGTYLFLQNWYKKKYESYLFKNRNDLYNIITYITDSKGRGLKDKEIASKLKKSGWSAEQVSYVMKKYAGKRTGMFELPIEKILGKFKKKRNIPQGGYEGGVPRKF